MPSERDCIDHLARVAANPRLSLQESIALGLLSARKWDKARHHYGTRDVTAGDAAEFDNFTEAELDDFRATAARVLVEHAATLPRAGNGWWRGFWQGFAASWAYALSIALIAFIIKLAGSDVLTVLRAVLG